MKLTQSETTVAQAASKAGMDEKTARKYRRVKQLPSQIRKPHQWRTRADAFEQVWGEIEAILGEHPTVQAKTMFEYLGRKYPGRFSARPTADLATAVQALAGPVRTGA